MNHPRRRIEVTWVRGFIAEARGPPLLHPRLLGASFDAARTCHPQSLANEDEPTIPGSAAIPGERDHERSDGDDLTATQQPHDSPYLSACKGRLKGVLRWQDLDAVWAQLQRRSDDGWYVYAVGESPPPTPASRDQFERFLVEIRQLLLDEHKEDYCGIVYADDHDEPSFVKIFDPNNLGKVCGTSEVPPLPGWTLSRVAPDNLAYAFPQTGDRRRWWQRIFR